MAGGKVQEGIGARPSAMTDPTLKPEGSADVLADIQDGCFALDDQWRFTYLNAVAERVMGRKAAALIGKTNFEPAEIDLANPFYRVYFESKQSGEPVTFTAYSEIYRAWLEVRGYPRAGGYTVLFRDVTTERAAHLSALERARQRGAEEGINRRLFETSIDLILVVDRKGNFIRVSPSAHAILGYDAKDMVGHSAAEFLYPEDLESTRNEMRHARRGRIMRNFTCRYVHKEGRIVPLAWTGVWSEPEQQHFFIGRDMTERIAAEERLRHSQRLESIGQLTGGIAHDFNNLLGIIIGNLELLQGVGGQDPRTAEHLGEILEAAQRGAELTSRLLAFARRQQLRPERANINALATGTAKLLARVLGENVRFELDLASELWPARVDAAQLEAAITNLATNARDAMPRGGTLTLKTANFPVGAAYAESHADMTAGDYVLIEVCDTGTGIPSNVQAHIFEPFFSTKEAGRGSGLGLSMVYGFIKQSGGHVTVYSELGRGTSFRLYLPRDTAATTESPAPAPAKVRGGSETILVVEDNAKLRAVAARQLRELGYAVVEAADSDGAFAALERERIDLLLTDIMMPGKLNGPELARAALARTPHLKVVFASGYPDAPASEDWLTPGAKLLTKPYRKDHLARALREVLD
jgi:PAS domain S-box-containing protein